METNIRPARETVLALAAPHHPGGWRAGGPCRRGKSISNDRNLSPTGSTFLAGEVQVAGGVDPAGWRCWPLTICKNAWNRLWPPGSDHSQFGESWDWGFPGVGSICPSSWGQEAARNRRAAWMPPWAGAGVRRRIRGLAWCFPFARRWYPHGNPCLRQRQKGNKNAYFSPVKAALQIFPHPASPWCIIASRALCAPILFLPIQAIPPARSGITCHREPRIYPSASRSGWAFRPSAAATNRSPTLFLVLASHKK